MRSDLEAQYPGGSGPLRPKRFLWNTRTTLEDLIKTHQERTMFRQSTATQSVNATQHKQPDITAASSNPSLQTILEEAQTFSVPRSNQTSSYAAVDSSAGLKRPRKPPIGPNKKQRVESHVSHAGQPEAKEPPNYPNVLNDIPETLPPTQERCGHQYNQDIPAEPVISRDMQDSRPWTIVDHYNNNDNANENVAADDLARALPYCTHIVMPAKRATGVHDPTDADREGPVRQDGDLVRGLSDPLSKGPKSQTMHKLAPIVSNPFSNPTTTTADAASLTRPTEKIRMEPTVSLTGMGV